MVLQAALYAPHLHSWSLVASAPSMLLLLRRVLVALREERENPREYGMPTMGLQEKKIIALKSLSELAFTHFGTVLILGTHISLEGDCFPLGQDCCENTP